MMIPPKNKFFSGLFFLVFLCQPHVTILAEAASAKNGGALHSTQKKQANPKSLALNQSQEAEESATEDDDFLDDEEASVKVNDPWEGFNRAMFAFNDVFIRYFMKPIAVGYGFIIPRFLRKGIDNVFHNAYMPIRFTNSLLQAKLKKAGTSLGRFAINTTIGVGGLWDPAQELFSITRVDEDTNQTLGVWGFGPGIYIHWPFVGPSGVRASFGFAGDILLKPQTWIVPILLPDKPWTAAGITVLIYGFETMNRLSLNPNEYEDLKKDAPDPYSFFRDIYVQNAEERVRN